MRDLLLIGCPCVLTPIGEREVRHYMRELIAKRKEILDAGKDTVETVELPTLEAILSDIETFYGEDDIQEYCNNWQVTDEYDSDYPLHLRMGREIITKEAREAIVKLEKARELWVEFSEVVVDDDGRLLHKWHKWPKGTDREEIWHWFEEYFGVSVGDDLINLEGEMDKNG